MTNINVEIKDLLEAGVHFGHQKRKWNPKMKRFVFGLHGGLYVIDLAKTLQQLRKGVELLNEAASQHKTFLFVGTKKQAKTVVRECAEACGEFFVCERWLGGMLTNITTIRQSIKTLEKVEHKLATGSATLSKKEMATLSKKQEKLNKNLAGIRTMRKLPDMLIVVDPVCEHIAVSEAVKLGIPVLALLDTNSDPDPIDHVIPCNDDALKSIKIIIQTLVQAIIDQKNELHFAAQKESEALQESLSDSNPQKEQELS